ncbi:MAG: hypothetical protein SV765_17450 [Pseudomonadota bacterium]|nr:hypothetical protein [Pseudomonadota bacterium]
MFKLMFPRFAFAIAVLSLAACGGGGGSSSQDSAAASSSGTAAATVQGAVVKGLVRQANVSVYAVTDGTAGALLASTRSDANGQYRLALGDYQGPLYLEVTTQTGATTLLCDSASGCGSFTGVTEADSNNNGRVDFGEAYPAPADFQLSAVVSETPQSPVSVTVLTHLAAALAQSLPQGLNAVSIAVAQSQIENLFQVASLSQTQALDLTNPEAVAAATVDELRYSVLAGALAGLTDGASLPQVLAQLTEQLQLQGGQLVTRDSQSSVPTLAQLVQEALATSQRLSLTELGQAFTSELAALELTPAGNLTEAVPSPTAGGDNAAVIEAFVSDLQTWQGYLSLNPDQSSFAGVVSAVGVSTGTDLGNMLQAVAIAGQYGPVVALPDAALSAACDSLSTALYRLTCRLLISGKSLEDICHGNLNLVLFNRSLCDVLNDLELPLGSDLRGHFALWDGVARIYGTSNGMEVDLTFTSAGNQQGSYGFGLSGQVTSDTGSLTISEGQFSLQFDGGIDLRNLKLPESAAGTLSVNYAQFHDVGLENPTTFSGDLSVNVDLSGVSQTGDDNTTPVSGLDSITMALSADGLFESLMGDSFQGSIELTGGADSGVQLQFITDLPDFTDQAVIHLESTREQLAQGQINDLSLSWGGKQYDIMYFHAPFHGIRVENQDGVIMDLDLGVEDGAVAGSLMLNGTAYGTVTPLNGSLVLRLSDGSEILL